MADVRFDLPTVDPETAEFWSAAGDGRLLIRRCNGCGEASFYPRRFCPSCWSGDIDWEQASGAATLYTWSVVHSNDLPPFRDRLPYIAAVVDLAEGPRMMTNVVSCAPDELRVGMALQVTFERRTDEIAVPVFQPV